MTERIIKHNPAFLTDEELLHQFVVRQAELEILLQITRENTGNVNQHAIVIGSRGMGKTMLMRRLAVELSNDSELNRLWLPVMIPEETYNVATEGELWLRVLQYVVRGYQDDRLKKVFDHLQNEPDEFRLKSQAVARLKEWAEAKKKRLIIMIENFNMILEEQAIDYSDWDLRKTLLNEPGFMIVATATARFDEIENAQKSMFELFREIRLNPLSTKECALLWKRITGKDIKEQKIRPMEILTGGNPRLLAILASFSADTPFGDLMRDLIILIDDHTSYFKANVEALPALERRIFVCLAEIWEPAMARDVAKRARLDVNKTSSLLKRLTTRGAVSIVKQEGRRFYYQVAERLYNIYHLMRQSSDASERACAVVEFMVRFYDPDLVACAIARDACLFLPRKSYLHDRAYKYLLSKYSHEEKAIGKILSAAPKQFLDQYEVYAEKFLPIDKKMKRITESVPSDIILPDKSMSVAELKELLKSDTVDKLIKEDPREIIEALNKIIEASDVNDPGLDSATIAECYNLKGVIYYSNKKIEEAIATCDEMASRFGGHDHPEILELVAMALVNKGLALGTLGKTEEAIDDYDEVVSRFGGHDHPEILELVAMALVNKGVALGSLEKAEEEMAAYDEVVSRFGNHDDPEILKQVARAIVKKGGSLERLGKTEEAIAACDEMVSRFGGHNHPEILEGVAIALVNKGVALGTLGKAEEEIEAYDEVVSRFGGHDNPKILKVVAMALVKKGITLGGLGKAEEAIAACDEVISRFGGHDHPEILELVAMALVKKGITLGGLGKKEKEMAAYDEVVSRFGGHDNPEILTCIAIAKDAKAWEIYCLNDKERFAEALSLAKSAQESDQENSVFSHTIAMISGALNQWEEAFKFARIFLSDESLIECQPTYIIEFFILAAAHGMGNKALKLLKDFPSLSAKLEPLVVALKMKAQKEYSAPQEVVEVAMDILKQIENTEKNAENRA